MIYDNILETLGNTPLVRLSRISSDLPAPLLGKVEFFNPGGSVKDRVAIWMINRAEEAGRIRPGKTTLIEPTSGNCGIGLAMAAAARGYRMIVVTHSRASMEKRRLVQSYGAELVVTPYGVPPDSPESLYSVAKRLGEEIPDSCVLNQYENEDNPLSHYEGTGKEIYRELGDRIDAVVAGIGTGGTITGVARYLKERIVCVKVIGVDPVGSVLTGDISKKSTIEGIGADYVPGILDLNLIDELVQISDPEAILWTHRLARQEGILASASSGAAVAVARKVALRSGEPRVIVVIIPDTGERYLSKYFSEEWLRENTFSDVLKDNASEGEVSKQVTGKSH
jgi:cystathionine beta-synthase